MITDEHLESLAGYVFDQDKLVTYKWLSKELKIHVNLAKQILSDFYEKYHTKNDIEYTYLLIGTLKDNSKRVEVVRESDLLKAKQRFSSIISEHLYSIHKPLKDLEQLASFGSGDVIYGAIKCDACIERNDEEIHLLRWKKTCKGVIEEKMTNIKATDHNTKIDKNLVTIKENKFNNLFNMTGKQTKSIESEKNNDSVKKDINSVMKDKDSIEETKNSEKESKSSIDKNENSTQNLRTKKVSPKTEEIKQVKKGGLDNFFRKKTSAPTEVQVSKKIDYKAEKDPPGSKNIKEKEKVCVKKRNRSQENNIRGKKRKRIVIQSDSSDSEAQSNEEIETAMPEVETEISAKPKSPSPPTVRHENGKRKVLKLVNKTFKQGEYMVTKKEHVYVSCSEDEDEKKNEEKNKEKNEEKNKEKNEEKNKEKKKKSSKVTLKAEGTKKKQTTLTNFFKKS